MRPGIQIPRRFLASLVGSALAFASSAAVGEQAAPQPQVVWQIELSDGPKDLRVAPDGTLYVLTRSRHPSLAALAPGGSVRWSWTSHRHEDPAAAPAFDREGNVHVLFGDRLVKLAPSGRVQWTRRFLTRASVFFGPMRMPGFTLLPDGSVYVAAEYLSAFGPDGGLRWQFRGGGPLSAPHVGADGSVEVTDGTTSYAVSASGARLRAVPNPTSGEFAAEDGAITYRLGWIALAAQRTGFNQVAAERQGAPLWTFAPGPRLLNVAPVGDVVYVGGEILAALDARSGRPRFRLQTNRVAACPTPAGVVAGCPSAGLVCAFTPEGRELWRYGQRPNANYEPSMSVAAATDGTLYVAGDGTTLAALRPRRP